MPGRSTEQLRTYTEDDLVHAAVKWLHTGEIPQALAKRVENDFDGIGHGLLELIPLNELKIHNAKITHLKEAQTIFERPKPSFRRRLAATAGTVFNALKL